MLGLGKLHVPLQRQAWREPWWSPALPPNSAAAGCAASPLPVFPIPLLPAACSQPVCWDLPRVRCEAAPALLAWPQAPHSLDPRAQGPDSPPRQARWGPESSSSTVTPSPGVAPSPPLLAAKSCKDTAAMRTEAALQLASSGCSVSPKCGAAAWLQ